MQIPVQPNYSSVASSLTVKNTFYAFEILEALITMRGLGEFEHRSCAFSLHANLFNSYGVGGPQVSRRCQFAPGVF